MKTMADSQAKLVERVEKLENPTPVEPVKGEPGKPPASQTFDPKMIMGNTGHRVDDMAGRYAKIRQEPDKNVRIRETERFVRELGVTGNFRNGVAAASARG